MMNDISYYKQVQVVSEYDTMINDKNNKNTLVNMTLQNDSKVIEIDDEEH